MSLTIQELVRIAAAQGYRADEVEALCATPETLRLKIATAALPACVAKVTSGDYESGWPELASWAALSVADNLLRQAGVITA